MKKVLMSLAAAGLLLSTGAAFSQNTETKSQGSAASTPSTTQSQSAPSGERRERSGGGERREGSERRGERGNVSGGERREGSERRGERGNVSGGERQGMRVREGRERGGVNVRIGGDRDGYRYRRHHHRYGVYVGGCRTIVIKKRYHGHVVIKRIRLLRLRQPEFTNTERPPCRGPFCFGYNTSNTSIRTAPFCAGAAADGQDAVEPGRRRIGGLEPHEGAEIIERRIDRLVAGEPFHHLGRAVAIALGVDQDLRAGCRSRWCSAPADAPRRRRARSASRRRRAAPCP